MSTPASAYFMDEGSTSISGPGEGSRPFSIERSLIAARWARYLICLRVVILELKHVKQSLPTNNARMQQGVGVGKKALASLTGFPRIGRHVERHVDHNGRSDNVVARNAAPEAAVI